MIEGFIKIYLSHKEPNHLDNLLWLRPYLDREGYELLYYGTNGWTPLINECKCEDKINPDTPVNPPIEDDSECKSFSS